MPRRSGFPKANFFHDQERHSVYRDAGWGGEDEENCKLLLFIRHLPNISAKELGLMQEVNQLTTEPDEQPSGKRLSEPVKL